MWHALRAPRRRRRRTRLAFGGERDHGDGDAGNSPHRRFGFGPNAFPGAGLGGIDVDREKYLAVADRYRRQNLGIGQGNAARRHHPGQPIENLLLRNAHGASPNYFRMRPIERSRAEGYLAPTSSTRSVGAIPPPCSLAAS